MEKYRFSKDQLSALEQLQAPFAVYQFLDKRVAALVLSDGFLDLFGYADRARAYDDMNSDMYRDTHPDDAARIANAAFRFAAEGGKYDVIYRTRAKAGGWRMVHAIGKHVYTDTGARLAHVWYTDEGLYEEENGSALNRALNEALHEESLLKSSQYDYLTGLPNMTYFFELAEAGKEAVMREGGQPVLLYFDLNGMKYYNQKFSFAEGNELLRAFAGVMARSFGNESCCHISADHFAAFAREDGIEDRLNRFFQDCKEMNNGNSLPVTVGLYPNRMEDVPVGIACDRAKFACDSLRKTYVSCFGYYTHGLREDEEKRRYIISNLDRALSEKWIQVYYQPIVRAVSGRVCDEEALSRWIDPVKGFLSTAEFIPFLEEAGLIYKVDLFVLDRVLEKLKIQRDAGLHIVPQSVNLSRSDFDTCDIVEEIRRRVDEAGFPRDKITIEITESMIGGDFEFMKEQIERFQALGFPVWMDDFGSGYSSLDVLQSVKFNLIKFDMSFMKKLDEGDSGKIILTELMKMATSLGVDTVCEGVETEAQVRFLQEIGCSKLQGYYYCRPIPVEAILKRYREGVQIGFENPEESAYYESIGRVNLYDLAVIATEDENSFHNFFNTLPIGIMEIKGDGLRFARTNQSYRDFISRFFGVDLAEAAPVLSEALPGAGASFIDVTRQCCREGSRVFFDERMPDGSVVHSFVRRIALNPVTGAAAAAIAVLSISDPDEGASYVSIAKALAADYYNIYYVDLETDQFIEYSSPVGREKMSVKRHGENFFDACKRDGGRIFEEDREMFFSAFSKENVLRELEQQGVFTITYRLMDTGTPMYVNMKITRVQSDRRHIIMGISIIDSQMKEKAHLEKVLKERDTLARVMALSEDYLTLYMVNPETESYVEYNATDDYHSLGIDKEGREFFNQCRVNCQKALCPEDLPLFLSRFTKENVMRDIRENGAFKMQYRLLLHGEPRQVSLKIAAFKEGEEEKLIVGVRAWRSRQTK